MINFGNIPAKFKWTPIQREDFIMSFEPVEGVIPPQSEIPMMIKFSTHFGQKLDEILECDVEDVGPIGFRLTAPIEGLSVSYELVEEGFAFTSSFAGSKTGSRSLSTSKGLGFELPLGFSGSKYDGTQSGDKRMTNLLETLKPPAVILEKIELLDMMINKPRELKFVIKNTSGIETKFNFYMEEFEPIQFKEDVNVIVHSKKKVFNDSKVGTSTNTASRKDRSTKIKFSEDTQDFRRKKNKSGQLDASFTRPGVQILGEEHEKTDNFTSVDGQELNKNRRLEKDSKFYLTNNKGIAAVCVPKSGILHAHEEIIVNLTVYNDTCGVFEDHLCCDVKGLPLKKFPMRLNVTGSPLVVTPNQVGVDFKSDYPSFTVGSLMHSFPPISKQFKLTNTGPDDLIIGNLCFFIIETL